MVNKKYEIKYTPTFITQFNNILYYIAYELKNKIDAENHYNDIIIKIEKRSMSPEIHKVFKVLKDKHTKYYKINVKNYSIFYVIKGNAMEVRRIYYS